MALQIQPDRAYDSSAPISSAFREFSIYSLPEFLMRIIEQASNSRLLPFSFPHRIHFQSVRKNRKPSSPKKESGRYSRSGRICSNNLMKTNN
jgi:hypothetical protein